MNDLSNEEIAARVEALRLARIAKGRVLTEEEFTAIVGPPTFRSRAGEKKYDWRPRCLERVLEVAASMADEQGRVCHIDVALRLNRSPETVNRSVRLLKAEGRWPYATSRALSNASKA